MAELKCDKKQQFKEEELLKVYPPERIYTSVPYLIDRYNSLVDVALNYKKNKRYIVQYLFFFLFYP